MDNAAARCPRRGQAALRRRPGRSQRGGARPRPGRGAQRPGPRRTPLEGLDRLRQRAEELVVADAVIERKRRQQPRAAPRRGTGHPAGRRAAAGPGPGRGGGGVPAPGRAHRARHRHRGAQHPPQHPNAVPQALGSFVESLDMVGGDTRRRRRHAARDRGPGAGRRHGPPRLRRRGAAPAADEMLGPVALADPEALAHGRWRASSRRPWRWCWGRWTARAPGWC